MKVPTDSGFDPSVHLGIEDMVLPNPWELMVQIKIKQSKTVPFHKGITLYVGKTKFGHGYYGNLYIHMSSLTMV